MADKSFFDWMDELSKFEPFQNCICLSENDSINSTDKELVLRFFIFKNVGARVHLVNKKILQNLLIKNRFNLRIEPILIER